MIMILMPLMPSLPHYISSAAKKGHLKIVKYLVEHYINNFREMGDHGGFVAIVKGARRHRHVVKYLRSIDSGMYFC